MLLRTRRNNIERARVLHYLIFKANKVVLHESNELAKPQNHDRILLDRARDVANGLELFRSKVFIYTEPHSVSQKVLTRQLPWFFVKLSAESIRALGSHDDIRDVDQSYKFAAAARFVDELMQPEPTAAVRDLHVTRYGGSEDWASAQ